MRILHIGIDSHFVDFMVAGFERHAPGANELVVVSNLEAGDRVSAFTGPTTRVRVSAVEIPAVRERAEAADVVVVHAMTDFAAVVCAGLPERIVVVWSGFGYDYYVGAAAEGLVGQSTQRLLRRAMGGRVLDAYGRPVLPAELDRIEPVAMDLVRHEAARRTDYFSAPVDADLAVLTTAYPGFQGEYRQLNYADLASMARTGDAVVTGDDILVGNSSSWANNHVEAFRLLARTDLGGRRVVVPLTYGDQGYRDAVLRAGEKLLGDSFHPLVDHLPLEEYLDIVDRCGVTLFHHRRQQGVGNIVAALQQGSWVYLSRANPLFRWLRSHGVDVRPSKQLLDGLPSGPVPADVLATHRAFLQETWGTDRVETNLRTFVEELGARVSASERQARPPRGLRARRRR